MNPNPCVASDPSIPKTPLMLAGIKLSLCFDLRALADAEELLHTAGIESQLLNELPLLSLFSIRCLLIAALRRHHPTFALDHVTTTPADIEAIRGALIEAWLLAMPPQVPTTGRSRRLKVPAERPHFTAESRRESWEQLLTIGMIDLRMSKTELMLLTPRRIFQLHRRLQSLDTPSGRAIELMLAQLCSLTANFSMRAPEKPIPIEQFLLRRGQTVPTRRNTKREHLLKAEQIKAAFNTYWGPVIAEPTKRRGETFDTQIERTMERAVSYQAAQVARGIA